VTADNFQMKFGIKKNLLFAFLTMSFQTSVWADDCGSIDPKWVTCISDSDCVLTAIGTCDSETSINRTYLKTYEDYHSCIAPYIGPCATTLLEKKSKKIARAVCKKKQCRVSR